MSPSFQHEGHGAGVQLKDPWDVLLPCRPRDPGQSLPTEGAIGQGALGDGKVQRRPVREGYLLPPPLPGPPARTARASVPAGDATPLTVLTAGTVEAAGTVAQLGRVGHAVAAVKAEAGAALGCGGREKTHEEGQGLGGTPSPPPGHKVPGDASPHKSPHKVRPQAWTEPGPSRDRKAPPPGRAPQAGGSHTARPPPQGLGSVKPPWAGQNPHSLQWDMKELQGIFWGTPGEEGGE